MKIKLKLIVAASDNMGIGKNGELPWKLKNEMAFFKRMTSTTKQKNRKNVVIMGRRTWESIPTKFRPLQNRINFVLSRSDLKVDQNQDTYIFKSLEEAFNKLREDSFQEEYEDVWIIGGSSLYKETFKSPYFHKLYLTKIHKNYECDTFLPEFPNHLDEVSDPDVPEGVQEEEGTTYTYHVYEKQE